MNPARRIVLLVAGVALLAALAFTAPLTAVPAAVAQLGWLAPVAGVAIGAALLVALVPRTPISLACGLLFGTVTGAVCALLVALIAAAVTFAAGRVMGREFVARRAGRHWNRLERWIDREGTLAVAAVRALPLGPYGLAGYAYGASSVGARHYGLGTLIAAVPSAVSYALLGAAVARADALSPLTVIPLAFGLLLSVTLFARIRWAARRTGAQRLTGAGRAG